MNRIPMFDISVEEGHLLYYAADALHAEEAKGTCMWLRMQAGQRHWVIVTPLGRFDYTVHEPHTPTELHGRWLPISERVIDFMSVISDEVVTLQLLDGAEHGAVQVLGTDISAAIDLVPSPGDVPLPISVESAASCDVTLSQVGTLIAAARMMPSGTPINAILAPPMWFQFSLHELAIHVDWSDAFPSRSTYRIITGQSHHEGTVAISPGAFGSFMQRLSDSDDVITLAYGRAASGDFDEPQQMMWASSQQWRFTVFAPDPLEVRWAEVIEQTCADAEFEVVERYGTEWALRIDDCTVRLTLHHGHPDLARISGVVLDDVESTSPLLLELNSLNLASSDVRYCYAERTVRALVDVRLTDLTALAPAIRAVSVGIRRFSGVLSSLAAFGAAV